MLRLITANGRLEIENEAMELALLKNQQEVEARAHAEAAQLSRAYTVEGLAKRLEMSQRAAHELIREGKIDYFCVGESKGYRVSEEAVRAFQRKRSPVRQAA